MRGPPTQSPSGKSSRSRWLSAGSVHLPEKSRANMRTRSLGSWAWRQRLSVTTPDVLTGCPAIVRASITTAQRKFPFSQSVMRSRV